MTIPTLRAISEELMLIINLHNAAIHHKSNCNTDDCNVSVMQLRMAAQYIVRYVPPSDQTEADKLISEMPII